MKIVLVGGGKVGFALCRSLVAEKHDVVLIEQDEAVLDHIVSRFDIMGLLGNGADFAILEQAGVQECDIFIALTEHDEVNMISAVLAKKMGAKETIVRVRNPEYSNAYFKEKNILGFSLIVNPELLAARAISNIIDFPNALSVERFSGGRVNLMEFVVKDSSGLCQMPISDFRKKFGNIIVCAMERDHQLMIPSGDITIQDRDRIFVTGNRVDMMLFHNYFKSRAVKSLLIVGAGKIAYYLLGILKDSRIDTKVIEINPERARLFSEKFPNLYIVQGDGTAKDILLEESAPNYDAVATLTGVDEENIITSMFLDRVGVHKNITKVNRTSLLEIIHAPDFSSIITPKSIAVDTIMHFIRGRVNAQYSDLQAMHHLANGQIETLQFQIKEANKMTAKPLSQLKLKKGVLIAAIIRKGKTIFPTGEDRLEVGDQLLVTTLLPNITKIYDLIER
ncbi:Trk system potassium uptake protein TrkA, N-terminal domain protein [Streptococcus sp. CM6]|uniref:Trk system potassium uptake protein TrkA n=2 Tax=Streptococcus oralis TaxID=1303 RepID=A0A1X0WYG9_STROR|nr:MULTISPECIES: Trk system potassium transporter TrkA [Streptococcus]EJO17498.1 Trk system potassium uptake protein TrkA, N-terminal domain protein [Streptococcus sp. BS35b]ETS88667.1 Trk system potassium uptake protein TrkA, N-terminal domain protein [Streptococcus sp. BS29a]EUB29236.1 Trk system potassium uptake protein TrkA, N-terminal domain protein [Streptococcus sp. BS21]EUC82586.1 Trk system potassium uptake protein TrkA, N-terminal domain protein [Streptococcus sp. CM6]MCY7089295.1 Tr